LNILVKVLSEAKRKNWNCLSPALQDGFSNFSGASLALSKKDKAANALISNRKYQYIKLKPVCPATNGRDIKKAK
jgi:hypothetical protein